MSKREEIFELLTVAFVADNFNPKNGLPDILEIMSYIPEAEELAEELLKAFEKELLGEATN